MDPLLLALALLAQPQAGVNYRQAARISHLTLRAESRYNLPRGLLTAVCLAEAGCRSVTRREPRGGCSAGPWQIYSRTCNRSHVRRYSRKLGASIKAAAEILVYSRRRCARRKRIQCETPWKYYNSGSGTWQARVMTIWRRLKEAHDGQLLFL